MDFGFRAVHETAERSKAIIGAFYGEAPKHSYFSSCSNGGRQALMEAQRFPADYDGIIAGAPASSFTHILGAFTLDIQATEADPAAYISAAKLPAIESAVLSTCDALDGCRVFRLQCHGLDLYLGHRRKKIDGGGNILRIRWRLSERENGPHAEVRRWQMKPCRA